MCLPLLFTFTVYPDIRMNCTLKDALIFSHEWIVSLSEGTFFKLNHYVLVDSSFWFDTINVELYIVYIEGSQVIFSKY